MGKVCLAIFLIGTAALVAIFFATGGNKASAASDTSIYPETTIVAVNKVTAKAEGKTGTKGSKQIEIEKINALLHNKLIDRGNEILSYCKESNVDVYCYLAISSWETNDWKEISKHNNNPCGIFQQGKQDLVVYKDLSEGLKESIKYLHNLLDNKSEKLEYPKQISEKFRKGDKVWLDNTTRLTKKWRGDK